MAKKVVKNREKTGKELTPRERSLANLKRDAGPGRPVGQRNYATIYRKALENIAKAKKKTPEEIEEMMEEVGLNKAIKGDYRFFKDVRDRAHGLPKSNVDITTNGESINLDEQQLKSVAARILDGKAASKE